MVEVATRQSEINKGERLDRIPLEGLLERLASDERNREVAKWIIKTTWERRIPTEEELQERGLNILSFEVLSGEINAYPGGAASPLAVPILKGNFPAYEEGKGNEVTILAMYHGAILPNIPGSIQGDCKSGDFHLHNTQAAERGSHLHEEMSCGLACGNTENTREAVHKNIEDLKAWAKKEGLKLRVIPIEAVVPIDSNIPYFRVFDKSPLESEDNWRTTIENNPCQYPVERLMTPGEFFKFMRKTKEESTIFHGGIICSDSRNGALLRTQATDVEEAKKVVDRNARVDYQSRGHTENFGAFFTANNEKMIAIAYGLSQLNSAILKRHNFQTYIAEARPFIINPWTRLIWEHDGEIKENLESLVPLIDQELGRLKVIVKLDGKYVEVTMDRGLQTVSDSGDNPSDYLTRIIRPGKKIELLEAKRPATRLPEDYKEITDQRLYDRFPSHAQGKTITVPGTRRPLGPKI